VPAVLAAGRRKGAEDERAIWPAVADTVRVVRPRLVVLEKSLLSLPVGNCPEPSVTWPRSVRGILAVLRAADVGAPHRRERIFVVAADTRCRGVQRRPVDRRLTSSGRTGRSEGLQRERGGHPSRWRCSCSDAGEPGPKGLSARKPRTLVDGSISPDPCRNNQLPDAVQLLPTPRRRMGEGARTSAGRRA